MLSDDEQVGFSEGVVPDQFVLGIRHRQQAVAVGRREDGTARHQRSSKKKNRKEKKRRSSEKRHS